MTVAQCNESSQPPQSFARESSQQCEHDALNESATMSSYGPREPLPITSSLNDLPTQHHHATSSTLSRDAQTQTMNPARTEIPKPKENGITPVRMQFSDFAEQLRHQQYFEKRESLLQKRKRVLQRTITLSARLHRVSSWIGDGLVEISEHADVAGFVRVHQHMQNLIDLSYSQWDHELHALDPLGQPNSSRPETAGSSDVLTQLSSSTQADLFDLLSYLRSNPRFLVERFKVLAPAQITALWNPARLHRSDAIESQYGSFMQNRVRPSHQRTHAYSKLLNEYATSFERSNPLSFLLYNMYGTNQLSVDAENQLRLSTWSTVCAELMLTSRQAYSAIIGQLLDCFAALYEWEARTSIEMFLMDFLQRGAFLLDQTSDSSNARRIQTLDPLRTPQAQEFFDNAVHDLFAIFIKHDGGFPTGALQFASAVLGKIPFESQIEFRGTFYWDWFIKHFLRLVINYPENESMLLKFHISSSARQKLLGQLWITICERSMDVYHDPPTRPVDPEFRVNVEIMIGKVDLSECADPYKTATRPNFNTSNFTEASISISISEIVQALEALSPQAMHAVGSHDPFMFDLTSAFYGQYAHASGRFDRLKRCLISLLEPGLSATEVHPCQEQWLQLDIDPNGRPIPCTNKCLPSGSLQNIDRNNLDMAQQGALRLFDDRISDATVLTGNSYRSDMLKSSSLETLFREMISYTSARLDPIACMYWEKAFNTLQEKYPLSKLVKDDSAVLRDIYTDSYAMQAGCKQRCLELEVQLSVMEDICLKIRSTVNKCLERIESLRFKVWYSADVVPSRYYEDAKNVARALNNMAISNVRTLRPSRPMSISNRSISSRSSTSSMFEQQYKDTMSIMKASSSEGGPKKLADKQIELTKNWLRQTHIENFCKGEERIHRFCMEVYTLSKSVVGETISESPVLWASDLFARERSLYDIRAFSVTSAPASTRPASVISDTMSTSHRSSRPILRSADSLRMALLEDRRSNMSRITRDCLPPELASSIGSLSRAQSATTAESISSVFSPLPSNSRSLTSPSIYSRSASIYNDPGLSRFSDTAREKTKFLEKVRQVLYCLLLSDLGCPVWSLGSETDAMLDSSRDTSAVDARLKQRMIAEELADGARNSRSSFIKERVRPRSKSMSLPTASSRVLLEGEMQDHDSKQQQHWDSEITVHLADLGDLLRKLSQQVDPMEKLAVAEEFYDLSLTTLKPEQMTSTTVHDDHRSSDGGMRRASLDDRMPRKRLQQLENEQWAQYSLNQSVYSVTAHKIVQHLKSDLAKLRPKTLFRDLQYISAFVPTDYTDNTTRGKALLQLGLAALAYKDEVCRSMVDVADKMYSQRLEPHAFHQVMPKVTEFWMCAAREGNAVAQRELAFLYLSQPEFLPIMSLPLAMPSQIFKSDVEWRERNPRNTNTQALALAKHWMQEASNNGDQLAQMKLKERKEGISIR